MINFHYWQKELYLPKFIINTYLLFGETEFLDPDWLAAEVSLALLDWVGSSPLLYFSMDCFPFGAEDTLSESCHLGLSCWKESLPTGWDGFFSRTQHSLLILLLDSCLIICDDCLDILPLEDDLSMTPLCMELDLIRNMSNVKSLWPLLTLTPVFLTQPLMSVCSSGFLVAVFPELHHGLYTYLKVFFRLCSNNWNTWKITVRIQSR